MAIMVTLPGSGVRGWGMSRSAGIHGASRGRWSSRLLAMLFFLAAGTVVFGGLVVAVMVVLLSEDLPDHSVLIAYEPPVLTRVHAADGAVIGVFAREHRVFTPIGEIPEMVRQAFISAEDKNFYLHAGIDLAGVAKAVVRNVYNLVVGRRLQGASTITQQVAKNMLLTREKTLARKIREGILAVRLGEALSKDRILELYLNEIFLGARSYGVTAATVAYFGKSLDSLELHEAAYLAGLPKGPNNYHPVRHPERALARRSYVLNRMAEDGHISVEQAREAAEQPIRTVLSEESDLEETPHLGRYFVEEVRRDIVGQFGEEAVYKGGFTVRSTISRRMQARAERVLRGTLERFDRARGYAGPVTHIEQAGGMRERAWRQALARVKAPRDITGWRLAVVLGFDGQDARIGVEGVTGLTHRMPLADAAWARRRLQVGERIGDPETGEVEEIVELGAPPTAPSDLWKIGDVVFVKRMERIRKEGITRWSLRQVPEVQGAFLAMDVRTGRVLAMQGGFSFQASPYNRATQARRQPGSAIKPVVYAAALDHGYTPVTLVLDAPLVLGQGAGLDKWRPENFSGRYGGPTPLRRALEESRNLVTVRVARDVGLERVAEYAERLGVYERMPPLAAFALGAGETGLTNLLRAYAAFANGGYRVDPVLVDRIQDRWGETIYRADDRPCVGCVADQWTGQERPYVPERGERVLSPETAFQMAWMLEGVVRRGTGRRAAVERLEVAGKTGTSNAYRDAWFIGFTPEIVAGCYIGYDEPRTLGRRGSGGSLCAPVVGEFFSGLPQAAKERSWPRPAGLVFTYVDRQTGVRVSGPGDGAIEEVFRAGKLPDLGERPPSAKPSTGGLY